MGRRGGERKRGRARGASADTRVLGVVSSLRSSMLPSELQAKIFKAVASGTHDAASCGLGFVT